MAPLVNHLRIRLTRNVDILSLQIIAIRSFPLHVMTTCRPKIQISYTRTSCFTCRQMAQIAAKHARLNPFGVGYLLTLHKY